MTNATRGNNMVVRNNPETILLNYVTIATTGDATDFGDLVTGSIMYGGVLMHMEV